MSTKWERCGVSDRFYGLSHGYKFPADDLGKDDEVMKRSGSRTQNVIGQVVMFSTPNYYIG